MPKSSCNDDHIFASKAPLGVWGYYALTITTGAAERISSLA